MPLTYDEIDGSWGRYSKGWPTLHCQTQAEARRAFVACTKEKVLGYGSYVLCDLDLRVETPEMLERLKKHLAGSPVKDADEIVRMYEDIELPLRCYDYPGINMQQYLRSDAWEKLKRLRAEAVFRSSPGLL